MTKQCKHDIMVAFMARLDKADRDLCRAYCKFLSDSCYQKPRAHAFRVGPVVKVPVMETVPATATVLPQAKIRKMKIKWPKIKLHYGNI